MRIKKNILIVGGGISGISAAVEIAEVGHSVILIEKMPYLGGRVVRMNQYFPKLCPPYCGLEINFRRIKQNPLIKVFTSTTIIEIKGDVGNFKVRLKSQPQYVNENCTTCGECEKVCPVDTDDEFNYGLTRIKAINLPHELAYPYRYRVNEDYCLKDKCKKCVEVCKYDAINFDVSEKDYTVEVDSIILATGWKPYDASRIDKLGYTSSPDIVTNLEFERLAAANGPGKGKILRPSDNKAPENIVFVQCAGSRDENNLPYCSGICCGASLKHALNIRQQIPDARIKIFYIDIRVPGRNEDMLRKVENDKNIELIKGKVSRIKKIENTNKISIEAEDILSGEKSTRTADLVVLATGIEAEQNGLQKLQLNQYGFLDEASQEDGIYPCGCAKRPMDVSSSIKDACGSALKAIQQVNK